MKHKKMKHKSKIKKGCFVQSTYCRRWYGYVMDVWSEKYMGRTYEIAKVLIIQDRNGNFVRKRIVKQYGVGWLKPCDPITIERVNKDWFK